MNQLVILMFGICTLLSTCSGGGSISGSSKSSNDEDLKKKIVGSWSYSITEEEDDDEEDVSTIISIKGTSTFHENGTCEDKGTLIITYIDEEGNSANVKYKLVANGKYDIQKKYLIYDYNLKDISMMLLKTDNSDVSDFFNEHVIPQLKHEMVAEDNKEKILELTDKRMKTESDGETYTYARVSK